MARLKDVLSTSDRGLIGITESGKDIKLGAPKLALTVLTEVGTSLTLEEAEGFKKKLTKQYEMLNKVSHGNEIHLQLGEVQVIGGDLVLYYNEYTERK